ncbi:hypothetical protein [Siccirubricoccus sp. G192]|uniref:hypothetical protein n=1 Tax=Siccirubricoccus sp. G192 TaxID=2849651 RepID=UPI001C2CB9D7|nr:hypothetical protein [Siccirubricoccus sp. G192]MBV1795578.1 hypothetical protein [Siccirubricoccus sp. G192]
MAGVVEALGVALQLHHDLAVPAMHHLGAQIRKRGMHQLRVDIAADGMGEEGMQRLAVAMVHGIGAPGRIACAAVERRRAAMSLRQINERQSLTPPRRRRS